MPGRRSLRSPSSVARSSKKKLDEITPALAQLITDLARARVRRDHDRHVAVRRAVRTAGTARPGTRSARPRARAPAATRLRPATSASSSAPAGVAPASADAALAFGLAATSRVADPPGPGGNLVLVGRGRRHARSPGRASSSSASAPGLGVRPRRAGPVVGLAGCRRGAASSALVARSRGSPVGAIVGLGTSSARHRRLGSLVEARCDVRLGRSSARAIDLGLSVGRGPPLCAGSLTAGRRARPRRRSRSSRAASRSSARALATVSHGPPQPSAAAPASPRAGAPPRASPRSARPPERCASAVVKRSS